MQQTFQEHKYINLTTFRKNGKAVPTPVWFVEMEGKLYVFTDGQSGKVKRIRANGRASVAPCDARGNPLGNFIPMRARLVNDPESIRRAEERYQRRYGFQRTLINWLNRLRGNQTAPVLLELTLAEMD